MHILRIMGDVDLADALRGRGIRDEAVLRAMAALSRRDFVPLSSAGEAQGDYPLPIGYGQTISQPYVVAFMTEALHLTGRERVLEVGTGSGYQAAVLAQLAAEVYTLEIVEPLADAARERLLRLGLHNVHVRHGDGHLGWPEKAPFDAIVLTAAPEGVPPALLGQLRPGGVLLAPVGAQSEDQSLILVERVPGGIPRVRELLPVRFVPMTGGAPIPP